MKLYYSPGACSLSPHIVLAEAGVAFDLERVDTHAHKTETGRDFFAINPKGYVPALELTGGGLLTEGAAIVQYIADQHPEARLAPTPGTLERARLQEHLNFISSELHKAFSPLFSSDTPPPAREAARARVARRFDDCERLFTDGRAYLMGETFSVADAYLFVIARWAKPTGIDLARWPQLAAYVARVGERKSVREALAREGLN